MTVLTPAEIARFYSKLSLSGCGVTWAGPVNNHGYGRFEYYRNGKRRRVLAHRLAFFLATGHDPGGSRILHACDRPPCCTVDCLQPGTQAQNIRDAVERGRVNLAGLLVPLSNRATAAAARLEANAKRCRRCRATKPLSAFCRSSCSLDGRHGECKECQNDRRLKRRRLQREAA